MSLLKEDCQAFGVIVSQSISKEDACVKPITSVPLPILTPERELRQSDKFSLRNFLMREANAIKHIYAEDTTWLVDGSAAVRASKPCNTVTEWINIFYQIYVASPSYSNKRVCFDQ